MSESIPITAEELEKLRAELTRLKTVGRRRAREEMAKARSFGDFRENAEFDEAKRAYSALEGRIRELQDTLSRAKVTGERIVDRVAVGATVLVSDIDTNENLHFCMKFSPSSEAGELVVTPESPIGRALMGCKVHDEITVDAPSGARRYKVLSVEYPDANQLWTSPADPPS